MSLLDKMAKEFMDKAAEEIHEYLTRTPRSSRLESLYDRMVKKFNLPFCDETHCEYYTVQLPYTFVSDSPEFSSLYSGGRTDLTKTFRKQNGRWIPV